MKASIAGALVAYLPLAHAGVFYEVSTRDFIVADAKADTRRMEGCGKDLNSWRPHSALPDYWTAVVAAVFGMARSFSVLAAAPPPTAAQGIAAIKYRLMPPVVIKGKPIHYNQLAGQMQALHVPAVSVALIHAGKIQWVHGFGAGRPGGPGVNPDTLFEAGSISKPLTAGSLRSHLPVRSSVISVISRARQSRRR
jgi:hypothetical protein